MSTHDFPTAYTLAYVRRHVPADGGRILEVGCGEGRLARGLLDLGYEVAAVDGDADAVSAARRLGVTAYHAEWPDLDVSGFDAVVFTRSLHHIHSLQRALDRARSVLKPGGRVLVEDFGYDEVEQRTIQWFAGTTRLLTAAGLLDQKNDWLARLSEAADPVPLWRSHHDHDLHSADHMDETLRDVFEAVDREDAAYFFRYVDAAISDAGLRSRIGKAFAELEESLAALGQIRALGQRFVASPGV